MAFAANLDVVKGEGPRSNASMGAVVLQELISWSREREARFPREVGEIARSLGKKRRRESVCAEGNDDGD